MKLQILIVTLILFSGYVHPIAAADADLVLAMEDGMAFPKADYQLVRGIAQCNLKIVDAAFLQGACTHRRLEGNKTLLMLAAAACPLTTRVSVTPDRSFLLQEHLNIVQRLINEGADINAVDDDGYNALIYALDRPDGTPLVNKDVIKLLVAVGINPNTYPGYNARLLEDDVVSVKAESGCLIA